MPVALDNEDEYRLAERDVIAWLREQPLDLSELDAKIAAHAARRAPGADRHAQAARRARQARRRGRRGSTTSSSPASRCVVFAHHEEVQDAMLARFPDAGHLLGRDSAAARERDRPGVPGRDGAAAARLLDARRRPRHHAHPRVERRVPRARVDARRSTTRPRTAATASASTTRSPPGTCSPPRRSTRRSPSCCRASAASSARSPTAGATPATASSTRSCGAARGGRCATCARWRRGVRPTERSSAGRRMANGGTAGYAGSGTSVVEQGLAGAAADEDRRGDRADGGQAGAGEQRLVSPST